MDPSLDSVTSLWLDRPMTAPTFRQAMEIAKPPRSRFRLGSPCRFVPRIDFTCHVWLPAVLRTGDLSQHGRWDLFRFHLSYSLMRTSPRWQWQVTMPEWALVIA